MAFVRSAKGVRAVVGATCKVEAFAASSRKRGASLPGSGFSILGLIEILWDHIAQAGAASAWPCCMISSSSQRSAVIGMPLTSRTVSMS